MSETAADLFRRHHVAVYRYLRRMAGRSDVAEDLTQDVFVRVVSGLPSYESRDRELPWLLRIARHVFLNHKRTVSRHPEAAEPAENDHAAGASQLLGVALGEALARLPVADRETLLLHEQAGLSYREVARTCGMSHAAVRSRIHRARCALRADLASELESVRRGKLSR